VASATIVDVTDAKSPVRRLLIPAAAEVVVLGVAGLLAWLLSGFAVSHDSAATPAQQAQATVVKSAACAGPAPNDLVTVPVNGQKQQLKLDGCGNQVGQRLAVLLPTPLDPSGVVEPAAVAPAAGTGGAAQRLAFVLALVSLLVGGACGYWWHRNHGGVALGRLLGARPAPAVAPAAPAAAPAAAAAAVPPETGPEITGPTTGTNWFADPPPDLGFDFSKLDEEMSKLTAESAEEWKRDD
jgi:hypothetical protein